MSGYNNFNPGQDDLLPDTSFDLNNLDSMVENWGPEDYFNMNDDHFNFDADGTTLDVAGSANGDVYQCQSQDPSMLAPPQAQTFGAEQMSNMALFDANQANDRSVHTSLPAQAPYAQPESGSSPDNYRGTSYNVVGLNNYPAWSPTGVDQRILPQQYPPTASQSGYPVPPRQQWSGIEHTQFQQASQAFAGVDVVHSHSNFQPNTAGNHFFAPQSQGGSLNASHGFPHPAAAPVRRTLAPRPTPDAQATVPMTQESNHDAKPVPPPVVPKKKETKVKGKQTAQRMRPTTSNAKKPAVKQQIDDSQLLVTTLDEAKTIAIKRIKLNIVDDDRDVVAARPGSWVLKIAKAVGVDYRTEGEDHERLTEEARAEFTRWQTEHENKTWAILSAKKESMSEFAQSCAMVLYKRVLEAHQLGLEDPGKAVSNGGADVKMKCSERINAAITAIEEYSIVKYDLLRLDRLEGLIASPVGFVKRKVENCMVNFKKKKPSTPIWRSAPETKSGGKRKRKEPSPPPSDDEDEEDDQFEGQSDEEFEQPAKRTKRR